MIRSLRIKIFPRSGVTREEVREELWRTSLSSIHGPNNLDRATAYSTVKFSRHYTSAVHSYPEDSQFRTDERQIVIGEATIKPDGTWESLLEIGWAVFQLYMPHVAEQMDETWRLPEHRVLLDEEGRYRIHREVGRNLKDWMRTGMTPYLSPPIVIEEVVRRYVEGVCTHFRFLDLENAEVTEAELMWQWRVQHLQDLFYSLADRIITKLYKNQSVRLLKYTLEVKGPGPLHGCVLYDIGQLFRTPVMDTQSVFGFHDYRDILRMGVRIGRRHHLLQKLFRLDEIRTGLSMIDWPAIVDELKKMTNAIPMEGEVNEMELLCSGANGCHSLALSMYPQYLNTYLRSWSRPGNAYAALNKNPVVNFGPSRLFVPGIEEMPQEFVSGETTLCLHEVKPETSAIIPL